MKKTQYFQMEFKNVEVKEDGKTLIVEGYASTPDIDSYDDIVEPSAFQNTMGDYMSKYKGQVFLQHIREKIVGKTTEYRIEEDGLWVRIEFYNDIDGLFKNIQAGMISSFSIGFRAVSWEIEMIDERRVRRIKELQLVEISAVNGPANENATFSISKSIKSFFDNLEGFKSLGLGAYEMKSGKLEDDEEKMQEEEIQEVKAEEVVEEEKEDEENLTDTPPITDEESEEEVKEEETEEVAEEEQETTETPDEVSAEGEEKEEDTPNTDTKTDDVEIDSETLSDDDTEEVKSDEMKALETENDELKAQLEAKDLELQELTKSLETTKGNLEAKEEEIKSYLSVDADISLEKKSTPVHSLGTLVYSEFK